MVHQMKLGPSFANIYKVKGYGATPSELAAALKGSEIVLIPAGVPRKPGMTRDGTFRQLPCSIVSRLTAPRSVQHQRLYRPRLG